MVSHILRVKAEHTAGNTSSVAVITKDFNRLTLATDIPVNVSSSSTVCTVELEPDKLLLLRKAMQNITRQTDIVIARKKAIGTQIDILATQFSSYEPSDDTPVEINTDTLPQAPINEFDEITQVALFLGVACRVFMGVSRSSCDLIMKIISIVLFLAFRRSDNGLNSSNTNILKQVPMTAESAKAKFHLTGKTVPYAVCSCHCTYPPTYAPGSTTPIYPEQCTHHPTLTTECGEALLVGDDGNFRPRKTFLYHDFKDYLSSLLSRRDIEATMDQACDDLMDSIDSPQPSFIKTPFEAQYLHQFDGPQPGSLFVDRGEEGCYVFALHVDFFNPEGLNIHGASTSCGIISMACLNLPADIRYKPENMPEAAVTGEPQPLYSTAYQ
ncbi:hypothetical protein P692DRAFT_201811853 [Suillus brevipes Sb2]|nr:hypothetical protein P692DRAFT_201811853 [Suillus brevipes Sb2]